MAEIKIEKKKPIWPWILLFLGVLALIYFLVIKDTENDPIIEDTETVIIETKDTSENVLFNPTTFSSNLIEKSGLL